MTVGPKGQDLELALWVPGAVVDPSQQGTAMQWAPARSPTILLVVPDCRALSEELRTRGVPFLVPATEHPWGISATFRDPDGNLFSLNQFRGTPTKS